MDLSFYLKFDLKTVLRVEIDGQQLYIDGVDIPSVLEQLRNQCYDISMDDVATAIQIAFRLRTDPINDRTVELILDEMSLIAADILSYELPLSPAARTRLEKIKYNSSLFDEGRHDQSPVRSPPTLPEKSTKIVREDSETNGPG